MSIPFELLGNQVVVEIHVGGRGPLTSLLDVAVAPSVADLATARELGLQVDEGSPGEAAGAGSEGATWFPSELPDVRLGGIAIGDVEAIAADLSPLAAKLGRPLHAILGQSFFEGRVVQVDYPARLVRLDPHGYEHGVRAAIEGATDLTPVVTVEVNGRPVPVVLDTGSSLTLGIYLDAVEELGLEDARTEAKPRALTGARGAFEAYEGVVGSLALGGHRLEDVETVFLPRPTGDPAHALGNLGNGFLRHTVLTLDYPQRALYVAGSPEGRAPRAATA